MCNTNIGMTQWEFYPVPSRTGLSKGVWLAYYVHSRNRFFVVPMFYCFIIPRSQQNAVALLYLQQEGISSLEQALVFLVVSVHFLFFLCGLEPVQQTKNNKSFNHNGIIMLEVETHNAR